LIRAHLDAFVALLASLTGSPTNMPVLTGSADAQNQAPVLPADRVTPFIVVRPDNMPVFSDRIAQHSANLLGRLYVTCVGKTVREAQWAQEKSRALLVDKRPVVTGRSVGRLKLTDSSPVQTDRDVQPPLVYAVDVYELFSA
jgi:hypothetical protein